MHPNSTINDNSKVIYSWRPALSCHHDNQCLQRGEQTSRYGALEVDKHIGFGKRSRGLDFLSYRRAQFRLTH